MNIKSCLFPSRKSAGGDLPLIFHKAYRENFIIKMKEYVFLLR
ncbi:hypothetical protein HMPREF0083_06049 [Aneurinibacillus aneurinilyticus ATCC 12856]|uniref:Uncharacterized protein n=1 Tax=Aneurinibacillus aneurinilyticus ATCC 12856 TaxID=649747 RepID=U1Y0F3_ANEAE|nr:hypothetical protein HMPREF0083_06049 [Aneurinibacillus aneurinilyticus ATCC 12856]